jgi:hypothetical protein
MMIYYIKQTYNTPCNKPARLVLDVFQNITVSEKPAHKLQDIVILIVLQEDQEERLRIQSIRGP